MTPFCLWNKSLLLIDNLPWVDSVGYSLFKSAGPYRKASLFSQGLRAATQASAALATSLSLEDVDNFCTAVFNAVTLLYIS